jgi:hypothetical protein
MDVTARRKVSFNGSFQRVASCHEVIENLVDRLLVRNVAIAVAIDI